MPTPPDTISTPAVDITHTTHTATTDMNSQTTDRGKALKDSLNKKAKIALVKQARAREARRRTEIRMAEERASYRTTQARLRAEMYDRLHAAGKEHL